MLARHERRPERQAVHAALHELEIEDLRRRRLGDGRGRGARLRDGEAPSSNGELVLEYEKPQLDPKDADAKKLIKDGKLLLEEGYIRSSGREPPDGVPQGRDQGAEEVANGPASAGRVSDAHRLGPLTPGHSPSLSDAQPRGQVHPSR